MLSLILLVTGCEKTKLEAVKHTENVSIYKVRRVDIPYQDFTNPVVYKNELYAAVNDKSTGTNTLIQMNMKTNKITALYKSELTDPMLQGSMVNKDWIIWVDAVADGKKNKTYAMNKKTRKITQISASVPGFYTADAPFLYKDNVAFIYVKENREVVVRLYDLKRNTFKDVAKVNKYNLYNNFVHMSDGKLVWTDSNNDRGYYYIYDLKTDEKKSYDSPFKYPGYAQLANNKIYGIHFDDYKNWSKQHFGYYDIEKKKFVNVDTHSPYINYFDVFGQSLAIINDQQEFSMYQVTNKEIKKLDVDVDSYPDIMDFSSNGDLVLKYTSNLKHKINIVE